ncbi:MAG TPA: VOC family protein [Pseudomonas xinjiangensis]|uniref:Bleomycin resistance protein n=2 Tax=root TaxID=1 RepID=A0A7V1FQT1_9GAMM|nr:VOC family protein [Halopseudomonas xinjiangensis]HEC47122.1 VOC family protein [Halopseudomonas xinjiangensis]
MSASIHSTVPVLASLAIADTLAFYTNRLGFKICLQQDDYAIVSRDGAEIHFWLCSERHIAENTSCYLRVTDTQALYEEFQAKGLYVEPPAVREWGMKELYVHDAHGNLLKFGEAVGVDTDLAVPVEDEK